MKYKQQWYQVLWFGPNGGLARTKSYRCVYAALTAASLWSMDGGGGCHAAIWAGPFLVWRSQPWAVNKS